MRLDLFKEKDKVLLLGEGNFSFSVCLYKHRLPIEIFPTCYEKEILYSLQQENVKFLTDHNVPILFNVDATKLHENPNISQLKFNKIVFNFPHVGGKMKIHLNRKLLKSVFESSSKILEEGNQMLVSLCGGQGGTPADRPRRAWSDSWQVAEMAAHGHFVLVAVEPFVEDNFSEYHCVGYRGNDTKFNLKGALVHVFCKRKPPFERIDEEIPGNRLSPCVLNGNSGVTTNIVYCELYSSNPFLNPKSCVTFLTNILIEKLKETNKDVKILSDDVVPIHVADKDGPPCEVKNVQNGFSLRSCSLQILNEIFRLHDHNSISSEIIFFPGLYFQSKFSENFLKNPPVSLNILVIGCDIVNHIEKYFSTIVELFRKVHFVKRHTQSLKTNVIELGDDCYLDSLMTKLWFRNEEAQSSCESCTTYALTWFGKKVDACVIHIDSVCDYFFETSNWREIWDHKSEVLVEENGIPVLKGSVLYPASYDLELTLRYSTKEGFSEKKFIQILWMAGAMVIENVALINYYDSGKDWSSNSYRITYRSLDKPFSRNMAIEIHSKIVGKMLEKGLNVVVA